MSTDPFEDPASSVSIEYPPLLGALLMFEVLYYEDHLPTRFTEPGEKNPAVRVNLTVVDGPKAGEVFTDTVIFPKQLIGQLRSRIGKRVLGRLAQGDAQAGKSRPWILNPATDADKQAAARLLTGASSSGTSQTPSAASTQHSSVQESLPVSQGSEPPF
jgi:hypothetical protein